MDLNQVNTKLIRIITKDKLLLSGALYTPVRSTDKAIFHIHGMAGNFYENKFLDNMAETYTANGYAFLSINTRGSGSFSDFPIEGTKEEYKRIGNAYEIFEESIYDIKAGIDFLQKEGYTEIILQGHSLGSVKVAYYVAETQDKRISKLILISPSDMVGLTEDKDHERRMTLSGKGQ